MRMEQKTISLLIIVGVAAVVLISLAFAFNKGPIISEIPLQPTASSSASYPASPQTTNNQNAFAN